MKPKFLLWLATSLLAVELSAQINGNDAATEILKPFQAKLAESQKFNATPVLPVVDTQSSKKLDYVVPTRLKELQYTAAKLNPLDLSQTSKNKNQEAFFPLYAKLGVGYPLGVLGELSYHLPANKQYRFGATYKHHSGRGNYNDNQRFSDNLFNAEGTYFLDNGLAIDGGIHFSNYAPRFYGYGDSLELPKDSVKQSFTRYGLDLGLFNGKINAQNINYKGKLSFYQMSDRFDTKEFNITPEVNFEKWFGKGNKRHVLGADLLFNYVSIKDTFTTVLPDSDSTSRSLFNFHPYFNYNAGMFRARVGANLGTNAGNFFIYPDVEVLGAFLDGKINVYAGWQGSIRQNNFYTLSQYNPFIVSYLRPKHTAQQDFYGGVKGSVKKYNYDIRIVYSIANDMPFFLNDANYDFRRFAMVYDTAKIFSVQAGLEFEIINGLNFSTKLAYYAYKLNNLEKPYHRPNFESIFNLNYTKNKFQAAATFYINSGLSYFDEEKLESATLNGLFDFNLSATYNFSKNVSAFIQANNILNNRNQRWHRYPQIGFNAMLGVIVKF